MMQCKRYEKLGETLYTGELPNGLRINVLKKPDFRLKFAIFATDYGGAHMRFFSDGEWHDTPAGVAHFLEHKMFDLPDGENAMTIFSENGAQSNAFTSSGMTAYHFDCTEGFEDNLRNLLHFVSTPYFTKESVDKEQGIIGQEIGLVNDSVGSQVYHRLMNLLYEYSPIREQVIGSVESIAGITAETLYQCHKAFYAPSNMVLCVAGDVDPERVFDIAAEMLPAERAEKPEADLGAPESALPAERFAELSMEVSAPQFCIGAKVRPAEKGVSRLRQKIVSQLALRTLFGTSGDFYNRLYTEGVLNPDYDYENYYTAGTATVMLSGESNDPQRVLREVAAAVEGVKEHGLDKRLFDIAKKASFGARLRGLEDFDASCVSLTEGLFDGYCSLDGLAVLESVEIKECEDFLTEYLAEERLAMCVVYPPERKD